MPDVSQFIMLVILIGVLVLAGFGYARLGRKSPRLTVLVVGIVLLIISASYQPLPSSRLDDAGNLVFEYSREKNGVRNLFLVLLRCFDLRGK
jgi:hypothetical protein